MFNHSNTNTHTHTQHLTTLGNAHNIIRSKKNQNCIDKAI